MDVFETKNLSLGYDHKIIIEDLSMTIRSNKIIVLIGPNGCGKSTLLRGIARIISPHSGTVLLDGKSIHSLPTKQVAKKLAMLPQSPTTFEGISVAELVSLGRYPHQGLLKQWSEEDQNALEYALEQTKLTTYADKKVDSLSGGQRQRAWIAMTLAQQTSTILLDEPTTYLDLAHQVDILNLLQRLNHTERRSIIMVLHDVNLAARYADELLVLKEGNLVERGKPCDIVTKEMMRNTFGLDCEIITDPISNSPMCIPHMASSLQME